MELLQANTVILTAVRRNSVGLVRRFIVVPWKVRPPVEIGHRSIAVSTIRVHRSRRPYRLARCNAPRGTRFGLHLSTVCFGRNPDGARRALGGLQPGHGRFEIGVVRHANDPVRQMADDDRKRGDTDGGKDHEIDVVDQRSGQV